MGGAGSIGAEEGVMSVWDVDISEYWSPSPLTISRE